MIKKILLAAVMSFMFIGCQMKSLTYVETFPNAVLEISDQLSNDITNYDDSTILFTSLVDLNDLKESSNFGRLFSESLMTEMARKGYSVAEYRGDNIVTRAQKGEFRLNRAKVKTDIGKNVLVMVGTYSKMDENVIVNVRIVDNNSSMLISAASAYIPLLGNESSRVVKKKKNYRLQIVPSDCTKSEYCWRDINE